MLKTYLNKKMALLFLSLKLLVKKISKIFSADSDLDLDKFATIGIIKNKSEPHDKNLNSFFKKVDNL